MRFPRVLTTALIGAMAAGLTACQWGESTPRRPVPRGWVAWDLVQDCLGESMRAPMPVHYRMPLDDALAVLGPPQGELKDVSVLRDFPRTDRARAYYWQFSRATLYLVFESRTKAVLNMIVVDDATNMGQDIMPTREEILSLRVKPGMGADEVYRIMGPPDRVERFRESGYENVDRFCYEPEGEIASPIFIDINPETLTVIGVSTAPKPETGPPPGFE
jgi:hypothetical protein